MKGLLKLLLCPDGFAHWWKWVYKSRGHRSNTGYVTHIPTPNPHHLTVCFHDYLAVKNFDLLYPCRQKNNTSSIPCEQHCLIHQKEWFYKTILTRHTLPTRLTTVYHYKQTLTQRHFVIEHHTPTGAQILVNDTTTLFANKSIWSYQIETIRPTEEHKDARESHFSYSISADSTSSRNRTASKCILDD